VPPASLPTTHPAPTAQTLRPAFRRDVQGLRGLAVLLVVAFHAGWGMTGGYVGVDVFFVISGFVIGRLLLTEVEATGILSLRRFYTRRVRRLLPALATVTTVTVIASAFLLGPDRPLRTAAATAIAASLFCANCYLYMSGGDYFDLAAEHNPLLHTWSLSVEEQFYFVLPAALIALVFVTGVKHRTFWRAGLLVSLVAVTGLSLWFSWRTTAGIGTPLPFTSSERLAFYAPHTRVWEFAAGVLLAVILRPATGSGYRFATAVGVLGLGMVLYAGAFFDDLTAFPGVAAALPVAGTVLLLVTGDRSDAMNRLFSQRWIVTLGDLSYSWYLWHWPAIVLSRAVWPNAPLAATYAAVGSLVPAWLSYRLLERPIRANDRIVGRKVLLLVAACILIPVAVGVAAIQASPRLVAMMSADGPHDGAEPIERPADPTPSPEPEPPEDDEDAHALEEPDATSHEDAEKIDLELHPRISECHQNRWEFEWRPAECLIESDPSRGTILLAGDSHAHSLSGLIIPLGHTLERDVATWSLGATPFGSQVPAHEGGDGAVWTQTILDLVEELEIELVVVAQLSAMYVEHDSLRAMWRPIDEREREGAEEAWEEAVDHALTELAARGASVLWVATVPQWEEDPEVSRSLLNPEGAGSTMTLQEVEQQRAPTVPGELAAVSRHAHARYYDPLPRICNEVCAQVADGELLYSDANHLSDEGILRLSGDLLQEMRLLLR
jgi:peptidoglycan/LPS O-acetylase OafA/YrhL